jgi:hypothetical protein
VVDFGTRILRPFTHILALGRAVRARQAAVGLFRPPAPPRRLDLRPVGKERASGAEKAGFNIREGINAKAFGINLVTRWLRSGRLKVVRSL